MLAHLQILLGSCSSNRMTCGESGLSSFFISHLSTTALPLSGRKKHRGSTEIWAEGKCNNTNICHKHIFLRKRQSQPVFSDCLQSGLTCAVLTMMPLWAWCDLHGTPSPSFLSFSIGLEILLWFWAGCWFDFYWLILLCFPKMYRPSHQDYGRAEVGVRWLCS